MVLDGFGVVCLEGEGKRKEVFGHVKKKKDKT